jgi:hypothetical protein
MILDIALLVICAGFWYTGYLLWTMGQGNKASSILALVCGFFSFLAFWAVVEWLLLAVGLFCLFTLVMLS